MPAREEAPLHALSQHEHLRLLFIARYAYAWPDVGRRANALLAATHGRPFAQVARQVGFKRCDSVARLVARFNEHGLSAVDADYRRGPKPTEMLRPPGTYSADIRFVLNDTNKVGGRIEVKIMNVGDVAYSYSR